MKFMRLQFAVMKFMKFRTSSYEIFHLPIHSKRQAVVVDFDAASGTEPRQRSADRARIAS